MITLICVELRSPNYAEEPQSSFSCGPRMTLLPNTHTKIAAKDACLSGIKGIFPPLLQQHPHLAAMVRQSGLQCSRSRQQTAGQRPSYVTLRKHAVTMKLCGKQSSSLFKR